jgi:hypothetical protein
MSTPRQRIRADHHVESGESYPEVDVFRNEAGDLVIACRDEALVLSEEQACFVGRALLSEVLDPHTPGMQALPRAWLREFTVAIDGVAAALKSRLAASARPRSRRKR